MRESVLRWSILIALGAPALLAAALGLPSLVAGPWREGWIGRATRWTLFVCLAALAAAGLAYAAGPRTPVVLRLGDWFSEGGGFAFDLLIDGWSLGFAALSVVICGIVSSFSYRYLHREEGFHRYFVLLVAFVGGILLISLAGSIEVLFAGWEILGLSSALLVAFFHERPVPVDNGFRVLAFYRVGDACMLAAAVLLHHWAGSGSFSQLFTGSEAALAHLGPERVAALAVLLLAAAAAKSALLPFSAWLPRAMEGPTPSSAVYYGALSIHAGCYLLLRVSPLVLRSPSARLLAAAAGSATAVYAALAGRAQTDVKSRLCYASLTQVGVIVVELSLGWNTLAFLHMAGNACLRLLQFLSAPNVLRDLRELENNLGGRLAAATEAPTALGGALYLLALEQGFLDGLAERYVVSPLARAAERLERLDRRLARAPLALLGGDRDGA